MHLAYPTARTTLSYLTQLPNMFPYPLKSKILHGLNLTYIPLQLLQLITYIPLLLNQNLAIHYSQQSIDFGLHDISFSFLKNDHTDYMVFQGLLGQVAMFDWTEVTVYILLLYLYLVYPAISTGYAKYTSL